LVSLDINKFPLSKKKHKVALVQLALLPLHSELSYSEYILGIMVNIRALVQLARLPLAAWP
jgi:hypothetical protein